MKLVLVLVVMCLVGAALSKSVRHKRSLGQTRKRGELEKLLKLLLEKDDKKDTAAKRGLAKSTKRGGGNPCERQGVPTALKTLATNLDNGITFTMTELRNAITPPTKKRMFHKRQGGSGGGGDPGKAIKKCVEELLEELVETVDIDTCTEPTVFPEVPTFDALFTGDRPPLPTVLQGIKDLVDATIDANAGLDESCLIVFAVSILEDACLDPLVTPELAILVDTWDLTNPPDITVALNAISGVKRRLLHWKRGRRSVYKRQPGPMTTDLANLICTYQRLYWLEDLVEEAGICDNVPEPNSVPQSFQDIIDGMEARPRVFPALVDFLNALQAYLNENGAGTDAPTDTQLCVIMAAGEMIDDCFDDDEEEEEEDGEDK